MAQSNDISIIIPALNSMPTLERTLAAAMALSADIIVVDGGSTDGTGVKAGELGAKVISSERGRGLQLALGAESAQGAWLLFLHSDTMLDANSVIAAARHCNTPGNAQRVGYFRLEFDTQSLPARLVSGIANIRARWFGLPYGDQGLLISKAFYEGVGGFDPLPLMEDVDIVRRIGRKRLVPLDAAVATSAMKYRRDGWLLRPLRNLACLSLYFLGVAPARIAKIYG
jgi:rSAM/selenodomain-associated transferase 2